MAIKVLREEYAADPEVVTRFLRERKFLQELNHPHLVQVSDLVVEGDTLAVVMELVDGQDLREAAHRGRLNTDEILSVTIQIAHALAYIHSAGVLHRDVKPENILLTGRGGQIQARLTDFGLAWVADGRQLTRSTHMVGTPAYLAPELLASRPYGPAVDVYALGVTAYELLCGARPFEGHHPLALMRAHLDEDPKRPVDMSDDTWAVLAACLAKRPEDRPTAAQLAGQFERLRDASVRLAIDFGTATTAAVLRWADGRTESLRFDGSPVLPSAVFAEPDGTLLTGRKALDTARLQPENFEPYPKLRIDEATVWIGGRQFEVVDLIAAVLRRVAEQAEETAGSIPARVAMTYPPTWSEAQRAVLQQAAENAGLPVPQLIAEPLAAAAHLVGSAPTKIPTGAVAVLYDLGAGSVTASVLRHTANGGFDVLASDGLTDAGGIDIDAAILSHLDEIFSTRDPQGWRRLREPDNAPDRRAAWQLWANVRQAKEILSRNETTSLHVPLIDKKVPLDRRRLEELAEPTLHRTLAAAVGVARSACTAAGVASTDIAATFMIGGSSRIPMASALLRRALGPAPTPVKQPELAVAEGALHLTQRPAAGHSVSGRPRTISGVWANPSPGGSVPRAGRWDRVRRRPRLLRSLTRPRWQVVAAVTSVLLVLVSGVARAMFPSYTDATGRGCGSKIAFLGYLRTESISVIVQNAVTVALEQYNATHADCTIALVDYNTYNPTSTDGNRKDTYAARNAEAIGADNRIIGVIGLTDHDEALLAVPILDRAGIPVVTPTLTEDDLSQYGWRVFHRTLGSHEVDVAAGTGQLTGVLKATKVFVVQDDSYGAEAGAKDRALATRLLGNRVAGSGTTTSSTDPSALVNQIKASGADWVYYTGWYSAAGPFLKQLRAAKVNVKVMASDRLFTGAFVTAAGAEAAEGVHLTCTCSGASTTFFDAQFRARFRLGSAYFAAEAYDAATVLLSGLAAGKATRAEMLSWVRSYDSPGLAQHIKFTVSGDLDPALARPWMFRITDGYFQSLTATANLRRS